MSERDSQTIVLSRQSILLVTAVSVGLLTLCYVLGVQVGKQSAALRQTSARGSGEDLQELPEPIQDQLNALENNEFAKPAKIAPKAEQPKAPPTGTTEGPKPAVGPSAPEKPKAAKPEQSKPEAANPADPKWTVQLVSTSDVAEAKRISDKANAAGFATTTVKDKGSYKVRLSKTGARPDIDAVTEKLKTRGFKTFPVKVN
jgi:cell division protein FtsN